MDTTIEQQVAMYEALIPHAQRLRIERSNFRLLSDNKSKESTLQLVYDVLRICPFFKAFLEDLVYQVKYKNTKKSNEVYYTRFTKVIIHHFMSKDPSIPKRNKVNWHYVRDDHMFSTIKLISRHQKTQQFGALLPIELKNEEIINSNAYKQYYAIATGAAPPKPKASVRRTRSSSDTSITPPTAAVSPRLTASAKGKQTAKASKAKRTSSIPGVLDTPTDESEEELSWNSTDDEGADNEGKDGDDDEEDEGDDGEEGDGDDDGDEDDNSEEGDDDYVDQEVERDDDKDDEKEGGDHEHEFEKEESNKETKEEESFDPIPKNPRNSKDEGNSDDDLGLNIGGEEGHIKEEEEDELYRDVNINQGMGIQATLEVEDSHVTLTLVNPDGQQQSSSVSSQFVTSMLNLTLDVGMESIFETTSQLDVQTPTFVTPLPMSAPTMTPSTIVIITTISQALILPTTALSTIIQNLPDFWLTFDRLRDEAQRENDEFLKTVDENMQKIIKEQVKEQVKTSDVVAADLLEMELKKILIKKMEGNKYVEMMRLIRMKNPPLDQTEGKRDVKKERSLSQQALQQKLLPGALAGLHKGPDLDRRRQASLLLQRSLCRLPLKWKSPHIRSLTQQYPYNLLKPLLLIPNNRGRRVIPFEHFINNNLEYLRGGASSRKYTTSITKMKVVDYGYIKWIEDLVPRTMWIGEPIGYDKHALWGKHRDPEACGRPSTGCRKLQEEAQPNEAGFNKDKKNRLMWINELHKFSDGMLTDVRTALDDRLKGIRIQYLPQLIWRKSDKDRAAAMIQAIDKRLKIRRIMRSLERFVGGRLYEGDFKMLQRTI
nr:hypothetical protein [Tanacetum cinerariifolium]